jgi:hypothetical protein
MASKVDKDLERDGRGPSEGGVWEEREQKRETSSQDSRKPSRHSNRTHVYSAIAKENR